MELKILSVATEGESSGLPESLRQAVDKAADTLLFRLAMPVPLGGGEEEVLLIRNGRMKPDHHGVEFAQQSFARLLLTPQQCAFLQATLDAGSLVPLEFGRALKKTADFTDPAASRYHLVGELDLGQLVRPGTTVASYTVPLSRSFKDARAAGVLKASRLPEPYALEGPPIEEVPTVPGQDGAPVPDLDAPSLLVDCGLVVRAQISVSKPLVEPWTSPEPPSTTLDQLIPPKGTRTLDKDQEQRAAGEGFAERCKSIARSIAQEYLNRTGANSAETDPSDFEKRQKEMRLHLNQSGKFQEVGRSFLLNFSLLRGTRAHPLDLIAFFSPADPRAAPARRG